MAQQKEDPITAAGGGLIRDHNGSWVVGFRRPIGPVDSVATELWALRDGLQLAATIQIKPLQVEVIVMAIIQLLLGHRAHDTYIVNLIHDCGFMIESLQVNRIDHTFRQ
ncbi:hypothetical protein Acr_11g0009490 [Actinidia rufa]|uniref:RNase H type-1 domain-containing protein n=1 Tax=Actinidia rufa TaxID=165716 RepID=A0A7J0FDI8_9ERIC|nr:hypothetical protein Acr_11g0009490 [Actinidia rufa]